MNDDPRFLRVRIRQTLRDYEPWVVDNLASIAEQAQEWWPSVQRAIDEVEDVEMTEDATRFHSLPADPWLRRALLHRHILRLDPEARDVSRSDLRRVTVTKNLELLLRRIPRPAPSFEYELAAGETITLAEIGATMSVSKEGQQPFMLPKGAAPHFLVRNRREGDRFHPLGAPGSKKLKDFLIDRKVPAEQRDRLPLLLWNGEIIWIAGVEVSERFKVRDDGGDLYVATINYGAK
jgi:tRNA(Ile)-lysidine synthetase-like protein